MIFYPVFLNLKNQKCLVVGGGKVAERKVRLLIKTGAFVYLVSPQITKGLKKFIEEKKIHYISSEYKKKFLSKTFLVIAATNNSLVNEKIYKDAVKKKILINCVDSVEKSNFISPAILKKGILTLAISTEGRAPIVAKKVKNDLNRIFNKTYLKKLKFMEKLRNKIKIIIPSREKKNIYNKLFSL